jgi:hypothetical protein
MKNMSRKIHNLPSEKMFFFSIFTVTALLFFYNEKSFAWGGRGHNTICEAAPFLVKDNELKKFLQARPQIMGHLCNIPDTQWRNEPGDAKAAGDAAHFIDPEILGYTAKTLPLDLEKLKTEFTGKPSQLDAEEKIFSVTRQLGSVYWRVDQLMNNLAGLKKDFADAKPPQNKSEEQNMELPFNKATYTFMTTAGIMGHYVGDTAQPYHTTADYDGYMSGHGGIHGYYEEALVAELDGDLISKVLKNARAQKHPDWTKGTYLERMKSFGIAASNDLEKIKKLDPVIKKSEFKKEKGMQIKTPASRKDAALVVKQFEPLIVTQLARAAWLLAQLWDEAYVAAGKPQLTAYRAYKFPFNVDFIFPTYDQAPAKSEMK